MQTCVDIIIGRQPFYTISFYFNLKIKVHDQFVFIYDWSSCSGMFKKKIFNIKRTDHLFIVQR